MPLATSAFFSGILEKCNREWWPVRVSSELRPACNPYPWLATKQRYQYHRDKDDVETGMQPRRLTVFLYGLFMDEVALRANGFDPVNSRHSFVRGMRLRIGDRATLIIDPAATVHGIATELTHVDIDRLYSEPSVAMYRPEAVLVEFADGSPRAALCFNLREPPQADEANPTYAAKLREVGHRLNLPSSYVESIK